MATKNAKKCITENRPKMLKEFLQEMNNHPSTASPRRLADTDPTVNDLLDQHASAAATTAASTLPRSRSRSRAAAEAALTSFQKLLNVVKSIQRSSSATSKPLTLTRSISRSLLDRFSVKKKNKSCYSKSDYNDGIKNKIKVRDILRWKSFRESEEPTSKPLDSSHCDDTRHLTISSNSDVLFEEDEQTFSTTSSRNSSGDGLRLRSSSSPSRSESGSSWGENELPCWWGNSSSEEGKKWDQNKDDVVATISDVGPKEDNHKMAMEDDKEQHSPVSVLDSPFREEISDQEFESSFDKILANMEKTKQSLLQRIQSFENLAGVSNDQDNDDEELVEYVEQEQEQEQEDDPREADSVIGAKTMAYINKAMGKLMRGDQGLEVKAMCTKDMEKQGQWRVCGEEEEELGAELEVHVLNDLVDEVLVDLFGRNVDY